MARLNVLSALAVVLPVLTVGGALLADGRVDHGLGSQAPTAADLSRTTLVCPSSDQDGVVLLGTAGTASGTVRVGSSDQQLTPDALTSVRTTGSRVVVADDDVAPALFAGRSSGPRLAATDCPATAADQWFTGVGAGAAHTSVLELTNPDSGPAVVTVTVLGATGPVDAPRIRGLAVPGRSTVELDLASTVPTRGQLALHVTTDRGRVAASVIDTYDQLGPAPKTREYLPAQAAAGSTLELLGLTPGRSRQTLVVANPGQDTARVTVQVITADSVFTPSQAREVIIDPQSVASIDLAGVLGSKAAQDAFGVQVSATEPVTAALRGISSGDLAITVPAARFSERTDLAVPEGAKEVDLAGASGVGTVTVVGLSAGGRTLATQEVELTPGKGASVELPSSVRWVRVTPARIEVSGAVTISVAGSGRGSGTVVLPLRELVRSSLIPAVRPGLP